MKFFSNRYIFITFIIGIMVVFINNCLYSQSTEKVIAYVATLSQEREGIISKIDADALNVIQEGVFKDGITTGGAAKLIAIPKRNVIMINTFECRYPIISVDAKTLQVLNKIDSGYRELASDYPSLWIKGISPNGNTFLSGDCIRDVGSYKQIKNIRELPSGLNEAYFLTDNIIVYTTTNGKGGIFNLETGKIERDYNSRNLKEGKKEESLVINGQQYKYIFVPEMGRIIPKRKGFECYIKSIEPGIFESLEVLDLENNIIIATVPIPSEVSNPPDKMMINSPAISPDGRYVFWAIGTEWWAKSYIVVIDIGTKNVIKKIQLKGGSVTNVVFGYE